MTSQTKPVLYDLITADGIPLSPWCWHVKMALAHKGISVETKSLHFTEKDRVIAAGGKSFPLFLERDGTVFDDSRLIIDHLEKAYPDRTLFPGGDAGFAGYQFIFRYSQTILFQTVISIILADIPHVLTPEDKAYFIASREKRFGMTLDAFCANRDDQLPILKTQLDPFIRAMSVHGFIAGKTPAMADYCLFGILQWARVTSPYPLYEKGEAVDQWMEKMLDLYDRLGRKAKACNASLSGV